VLAASLTGIESAAPPTSGAERPAAPLQGFEDLNAPYDGLYHFVRVRYGAGEGGFGFRRRGGAQWSHDYPRADRNFLKIVSETTFVSALTEGSNVLTLDDPELFKFPLAYIVEPGFWHPTDEEARALGEYLEKGGFLIVDDFRGPYELDNLEQQLRRVLPDRSLFLIDETNAVFDSFFRIVPEAVIPPYGGQPPIWYGIYEDNDPTRRLQVVVNYNNDIAEYWEYSDFGYYPIDLSNEAYKLGVNYVVYALTH
jgi:hypothetical protein